ncbi:uncharacterized protein LOC135384647 [Ornithodoros turicata]|uniref:uncharacterized protein LOC135384647 n=1 Tax=Ornithodoros turicata TaxID=34597 RepID=UPI003139A4D5
MAFMMPVVRNDFDIYSGSRSASPVRSRSGSNSMHLSTTPSRNESETQHNESQMWKSTDHLQAGDNYQRGRTSSFTSLKRFHNSLLDKLKKSAHVPHPCSSSDPEKDADKDSDDHR